MEESSGLGNQQEIENDLHWLGALIDGEGCFTLSRRSINSWAPRIVIVNTDEMLVQACLQVLDRLEWPYHVYRVKPFKSKWAPKAQIEIQGYKRVTRVLPRLIPYLRSSKRRRAETMLKLATSRIRSGKRSRWSDEELRLATDLRS